MGTHSNESLYERYQSLRILFNLEGSSQQVLSKLKACIINSMLQVTPVKVPPPFQDELHQTRLRSVEVQGSPTRF